MKPIWILLIIIALVALTTQTPTKKEWNLQFRCSEDKTKIELYNKNTQGFSAFQECTNGDCVDGNKGPECVARKTETLKQPSMVPAYWVIAGIALLYIIRRKNAKKQQ